MKECEQIGDLFSELHDQDLEGEIEKAAREHLHNCSCCREEFKWYGITVQALTQLERVHPPDEFLDQLHLRLQTCSPSYAFLDSFRNFFSSFPQLPVPVGVTALTFAIAVAWGVYSYAPPLTLPTGGLKTIAYHQKGFADNPGVTSGHEWQTAADLMGRPDRLALSSGRPGAVPKSLSQPLAIPTSNNLIGSDNLTVESPSITMTVESLKKVLPNFHGRLVEEKTRTGMRETELAVSIPPQAWPYLTTELINHGAVAVDSSAEQLLPESGEREKRNVVIRIRIVNTR
jgi:hypothetical protein